MNRIVSALRGVRDRVIGMRTLRWYEKVLVSLGFFVSMGLLAGGSRMLLVGWGLTEAMAFPFAGMVYLTFGMMYMPFTKWLYDDRTGRAEREKAEKDLPRAHRETDLEVIRHTIAEQIARVYDNDVNDQYLEFADEVMEVIRPYLQVDSLPIVIRDPLYVRTLVEMRNAELREHQKAVSAGRTATASVHWNTMQEYNREIAHAVRGETHGPRR